MARRRGQSSKKRSLRRRVGNRKSALVYIVTDGTITEKRYFEEFRRKERLHGIRLKTKGLGRDPLKVVERAADIRVTEADSPDDMIWALFDRDDYSNRQIRLAIDAAKSANINVGHSNPCFELWLLLHFEDCSAPIRRRDLWRKLKSHCSDFNSKRNKHVPYSVLADYERGAILRGMKLSKKNKASNSPYGNPSTGVWRLIEILRKFRN